MFDIVLHAFAYSWLWCDIGFDLCKATGYSYPITEQTPSTRLTFLY